MTLDEIELGEALVRLAGLCSQLRDIAQLRQFRADAEDCYRRAVRSSARLCIEDRELAARHLERLRSAIDGLSTTKYFNESGFIPEDFGYSPKTCG